MNSTATDTNTQTLQEKALDYAFRTVPYRRMDEEGADPHIILETARTFKRFLETGE